VTEGDTMTRNTEAEPQSVQFNAKGVLESLIEEEKAELLEKLEQAADKARIEEELAACDQLLKRLRKMRQRAAVR
jgi:hypothetical protein